MNYLKNHCWCSSSHWDGKHYDCQVIVSLNSYEEGYTEDWDNLLEEVTVFSQEKFDEQVEYRKFIKEKYPSKFTDCELQDKSLGNVNINTLKPEVYQWLVDNVPDVKGGKGWCIGNDEYLATDSCSSFSIFFQYRRDAMAFIKRWSKWKKPIYYCQYFTDVRKQLDLDTLKYI